MRFRALAVALVTGLAVVTAGCGGGSGGGSSAGGAEIAPASTPLFISVNTDFEGDQIKTFRTLLDKFPGSSGLLRMALAELEQGDVDFEQDVKPALGPELDIVVVDLDEASAAEAVALLQPDDPAKLDALLKKDTNGTPTVKEEVDGWTVLAESQASIDRFKQMRARLGTLGESATFKDAMEGLPDDTLARAYVNADAIVKSSQVAGAPLSPQVFDQLFPGGVPSVGGTVSAQEGGLRIQATGKTTQPTDTFEAALPDELPAGAIAYVGFDNLAKGVRESLKQAGESNQQFDQQLGQAELALGLSVDRDVLPLFEHEGAIAVYPTANGLSIPGVTLVVKVDDEAKALATVDKLFARASQFMPNIRPAAPAKISGIEAKVVQVQGVSVVYGAFDGKLVLTNAGDILQKMVNGGNSLADEQTFSSAKENADVPGETSGIFYVNLNAALELAQSLSEQPPQVQENVEPLDSFLLYSTAGDGRVTVSGFLAIQ